MYTKKNKPENQDPKKIIDEMIIEDLKNIESSSGLLLHAVAEIKTHAEQALQKLKPQNEPIQPETPRYFRNEYGGPWSNALRAMRDRDMRLRRACGGVIENDS